MFRGHLAAKMFTLLVLGLLVGTICGTVETLQSSGSLTEAPQPLATDVSPVELLPVEDWVELYFTDPDPNATRGGPDTELAAAIAAARASVDVAAYEINLWSIRDALLDAHDRGVQVRIVTETDNETPEMTRLADAGIPVVWDNAEGLMHHKFTIIDGAEVWMGSMNYTLGGAYRNYENLLRLRSPEIAALYTVEFEEMFVDGRFGARSRADTPTHQLNVGGAPVEVYFSPDDGVARRLLELVENAQESIVFMAFSFTNDDLAEAILDRAAAGVSVAGVMDAGQIDSNTGGEYARFIDAGLDVLPDGNRGAMHHKVLIIDGATVVTGSYNFSMSAETRNDENILILTDPTIARRFLEEYARIAAEAGE